MKTEKLRKQLTDWLRDTARLDEVRKWPAVSDQPQPPRFMVGDPCQLTGDGHHTMRADAFVLDETLGSIGVVHCLGSDVVEVLKQRLETSNPSLSGFIRQSIEEAVYLRHLMGMKVDASHLEVDPSKIGRLLPSVELVFVVSEDSEGDALNQVRDALIAMKRDTALLHAIGINLVVLAEGQKQDSDSFDRGFAWLLRHTRRWWESRTKNRVSEAQRLSKLKTRDFRVSGTREWVVHRPTRKGPFLHLLHGPNGSGKSSLAEAFEFAVTGLSGRVTANQSPWSLGGMPDAGGRESRRPWRSLVFDGNNAGRTARVDLTFDPKGELFRTTDGVTVEPAPLADVPAAAGALRIDQEVSDQLVKQDRYSRMEHWSNAYFREARESLKKRKRARVQLKAACQKLLPRSLQDPFESSPSEVEAESSTEIPADDGLLDQVIEQLKPLVRVDGETLSFDWMGLLDHPQLGLDYWWRDLVLEHDDDIASGLRAGGELAGKAVEKLLTQVGALMERAAPFLGGTLNQLLEGFESEAVAVAPSNLVSSEEFDARYAEWLNDVARTDLILNAIHSRVALPHAAATSDDVLSRIVHGPASVEELEAEHLRVSVRRDESRAWLGQNKRQESPGESSSQPASRQQSRQDPKRWIQAVSHGVFGRLLPGGEEGAMKMLLDKGRDVGWTKPFRERLNQLDAMQKWMEDRSWDRARSASDWARARFRDLNELREALEALARIGQQDVAELEAMAPQLAPALKELLELMTPASWAYKPINVKVDLEGASESVEASLEITARGMELQDVLNTAELNTAALAMHLLCAPLARNPYRVTFLDDPLQNMDELTVTTVARAMAKLIRLMSQTGFQEWDLVMLLHGADDCERMIQEAPAVFYRLPWSSPEQGQGDREESIVAEPGVGEAGSELFDFVEFLGLRGA